MKNESSSTRLAALVGRVDWSLLLIVTTLASIGILNLSSAAFAAGGANYHIVQASTFGLGLVIMGVMSLFDTRIFERWSYVFYGAVVALLIGVAVFGTSFNGSKRWINLGFFLMQPSELLKIATIMATAKFFHDRDREEPYGLRNLIGLGAMIAGGVSLVLIQPDLGTSLVILAIFMTIVLFEGMRVSSLITLVMIGVLSMPFVWSFGMKEYQKDRVRSFLSLEQDEYGQDWQVRQSIIAFGSGKAWGKGHKSGTQIQEGFVPEHENDFAAANWAEEHGFAGMLFLLSVYMSLIVWAMRISSRAASRYGALVSIGVAAFIFWHVLVNLCMVTGMLPVVGLPLPLMSAGRSHLLTIMIGFGLLMNVSVQSRPKR